MIRLLVSVRSAAEALNAVAAGAQLIDVKEPRRGSLGQADPSVCREVAQAVDGQVPLSVALGELQEHLSRPIAPLDLPAVQFAKLGLAGCAAITDWERRWAEALNALPAATRPVAVSYADWRQAEAPPPRAVIEAGRRLGCAAWLIDTFHKGGGSLLDHTPCEELAELAARAREAGMLVVFAGSLTPEGMRRVMSLSPDVVAVRGAACREGRDGTLDPQRVRELAACLKGQTP